MRVGGIVVVVAPTTTLAEVHDHAGNVAAAGLQLLHRVLQLLAVHVVLAHQHKDGVHAGAQHGRVHEGAHGRRVEDHVVVGGAHLLQQAAEALGAQDVRRVGDVRLRVQEVQVGRARGHHHLPQRQAAAHDGVDAVLRVHAQHARHAAAAHVALHQKAGLAAGGDGLAQAGRDEGLALVGHGAGERDQLVRVVHAHEADVGEQRLGGVLHVLIRLDHLLV